MYARRKSPEISTGRTEEDQQWLSEELGVSPSTVSKWCTNSSQPDVASLLKIADLLEVDIKELLVREYEQFLLSKIKD